MQVALRKLQGAAYCSFRRAFENNNFGKVSLINLISTWSSLPKHCIFADSLLIVSYVQGVLLIMFFHNKLLFYTGIEYMKPLSFFSLVSFMICCVLCTTEVVGKFTGNRQSRRSLQSY